MTTQGNVCLSCAGGGSTPQSGPVAACMENCETCNKLICGNCIDKCSTCNRRQCYDCRCLGEIINGNCQCCDGNGKNCDETGCIRCMYKCTTCGGDYCNKCIYSTSTEGHYDGAYCYVCLTKKNK